MPVAQKWHFTCPITGIDVALEANTLPDRWARIAGEVYSPQGMFILAHRIIAHPDATYDELLSAPYPSTVFDDWVQSATPPPEVIP